MILQPTKESNCSHGGNSSVKHVRCIGISWDYLYFEGPLKATGKEATKRPDEGRER